jgi:elongation factor Ts
MEITAQMVKELREATGATVLDSKKALEQHGGDLEQAKAYLAEQGLATAAKKADREAREGLVETYTHPGGRVGVMLEVNCETDFVANTDQFKELAHELALHVAFANPQHLDVDSVPEAVSEEQATAFREEALNEGKPEDVVEKIVEGRMAKFYAEVCLLQQPFVKDDEVTVGELVTQAIAELKENIVVRRFARFELGDSSREDDGQGD